MGNAKKGKKLVNVKKTAHEIKSPKVQKRSAFGREEARRNHYQKTMDFHLKIVQNSPLTILLDRI
jgi:hypothetical protein